MKIATANGKKTLKMTRTEWEAMGKKAGWTISAYTEVSILDQDAGRLPDVTRDLRPFTKLDQLCVMINEGNAEGVKRILAEGIDVNAKTRAGISPADCLAKHNNGQIANLLWAAGMRPSASPAPQTQASGTMKIVTAQGKKNIKMSRAEWEAIGKKGGWMKVKAQSAPTTGAAAAGAPAVSAPQSAPAQGFNPNDFLVDEEKRAQEQKRKVFLDGFPDVVLRLRRLVEHFNNELRVGGWQGERDAKPTPQDVAANIERLDDWCKKTNGLSLGKGFAWQPYKVEAIQRLCGGGRGEDNPRGMLQHAQQAYDEVMRARQVLTGEEPDGSFATTFSEN